ERTLLTYAYIGIYSTHAPSRHHHRRLQRHGRASAPTDRRRAGGGRATGKRPRRRASARSTTGLQAPARPARSRSGGSARRRTPTPLSAERTRAQADLRLGEALRRAVERALRR